MIKRIFKKLAIFTLSLVLVLSLLPSPASAYHVTESFEMITPGSSGQGGNANSERPIVSGDGDLIVFHSTATDLIPGLTTNGRKNIYLYDVITKSTKLVSAGPSGTGGDGDSLMPEISADGRFIVFASTATDLIPGLTALDSANLYLYEVATEKTTLLTPGSSGTGHNGSGDWGGVWGTSISSDGRRIAFSSDATDLVEGGTTTYDMEVYLYDTTTSITTLISKGAAGTGGDRRSGVPMISADGTKVVFVSYATDLIPGAPTIENNRNVFLYDVATDTLSLVTKGDLGQGSDGGSSCNGLNPTAISADNNLIAFISWAPNLISGEPTNGLCNIFLYNVQADTTTLVTAGSSGVGGNSTSHSPSISADGKTIGFMSRATDLIPGVSATSENSYVYDVATGTTTLLSVGPSGTGGNNQSNRPSLSSDASVIAFHSYATDLIDGITANGNHQIYAHIKVAFCDVTFDPQNGSAPWTEKDIRRCRFTRPTDPTRSGFIFTGWWTSPEGGTLWNFGDRANNDIALYAQWTTAQNATPGAPNTGIISFNRPPIFTLRQRVWDPVL